MTMTTYFGLLQGAKEANTEVALAPKFCAVPVLPATQTLFSGKPLNGAGRGALGHHAGQRAADVGQRVPDTGRCLMTGGLIFCTTWPDGETSASPIRGLYSVPPLASAT
jgi:hypothetical protein